MAEALYLLYRDFVPGERGVDGVFAVIINKDDAQTDAQIRASAIAQAVAGGRALPDDYFDNVTPLKISDLTSGALKDNLDSYVLSVAGGHGYVQKVEG